MKSTYYKSAMIAASASYLVTPATSINIEDYSLHSMLDLPLEDYSKTDQISSTKADATITLAQDWKAEMLAQTEVQAR